MGNFIKLDDSPMFLKQVYSLEQTTDELQNRCHGLYNGCKKFLFALDEACNGDSNFADCLETFGGGRDDPVSVSIGGPVLSKFITAIRELGSYKELLRSQVEHVLIDRLMDFMNVDLQVTKDSRRRFNEAMHAYDQTREKFSCLKKNTRGDIVAEIEEDLQNSKSTFEKSRFNLVNALMNIEAKKKYEFLESISTIMDAHLRYFKLGYDLLSRLEPFIHQVLTYAQQSKELANVEKDKLEKRIQEFRTQAELGTLRASSCVGSSSTPDCIPSFSTNSYRDAGATSQSTQLENQPLRQGYLLKRSANLKGDWKRRFFVLDNHGALYYYRTPGIKPMGTQSHHYTRSAENSNSVFGRFRSKQNRTPSSSEEILSFRTLDLQTSTIKMDAEDTDLRLCFRIISPAKTYTLQAENEADRIEWVNKIARAIASVFSSHFLHQSHPGTKHGEDDSVDSHAFDFQTAADRKFLENDSNVSDLLKKIPGNNVCAECCAPGPDWASLNLGILLCIECSGAHRNLGVHISKVRSLTLDVKVWEPTVLNLFLNLGNDYCNSLWEGLLLDNERLGNTNVKPTSIMKPGRMDAIHLKERYIQAKYMEKLLVLRDEAGDTSTYATRIWEAVKNNDLREVYRLLVVSPVTVNIVNTKFDDAIDTELHPHSPEQHLGGETEKYDPLSCNRIEDSNEPANCLQGGSLLHLACNFGEPVMLELLLQFGANINMCDFHGRTPLHHCVSRGKNSLAKFLLRRGARRSIKDGGGLVALERAMEMGAISDEELFVLLSEGE